MQKAVQAKVQLKVLWRPSRGNPPINKEASQQWAKTRPLWKPVQHHNAQQQQPAQEAALPQGQQAKSSPPTKQRQEESKMLPNVAAIQQ